MKQIPGLQRAIARACAPVVRRAVRTPAPAAVSTEPIPQRMEAGKFEREAVALAHVLGRSPIQTEAPTINRFGPGVYLREAVMPAGGIVVGHKHKTEYWNIVLSGSLRVVMNGEAVMLQAGDMVFSRVGVRKVAYVLEETRWLTIHPNPSDETDIDKLEELLLDKASAEAAYPEEVAEAERVLGVAAAVKGDA